MPELLHLRKSNCKNCYKCIRNCPVKAIRFSGNQAHVVDETCIFCGQCFVVCPQNAREISNGIEKASVLLQSGRPVYASLAPSFIANYDGARIEDMATALKKLGFTAVEETARGATLVKNEYDRLLSGKDRGIIITSSCHSINLLIQKHFPGLIPYLADVLSPMQAHAQSIKARQPDAHVVFIGPCISKKDEADRYPGFADCVLTFEELTGWLSENRIRIGRTTNLPDEGRARFFPTVGGILKTMLCERDDFDYLAIDGVENCMRVLRDIENGGIDNCFIEMSACVGSCLGGPVMEKERAAPLRNYHQVACYAGHKDLVIRHDTSDRLRKIHPVLRSAAVLPDEDEIRRVLLQMGKTTGNDELNCGSCGYGTCRDKAIAVCQGKADLTMCLPYLKDCAESFSDNIVDHSPNGIIVLNEDLEVQRINAAARRIMNIRSADDVLGEPVVRILDPTPFLDVRQGFTALRDSRVYLAEYDRHVEQSILFDRSHHILICFMRDVTAEESERRKKDSISRQTVEIADRVVEKQMRVVQEIASLLGETTAETKIALTRLKDSINNE